MIIYDYARHIKFRLTTQLKTFYRPLETSYISLVFPIPVTLCMHEIYHKPKMGIIIYKVHIDMIIRPFFFFKLEFEPTVQNDFNFNYGKWISSEQSAKACEMIIITKVHNVCILNEI